VNKNNCGIIYIDGVCIVKKNFKKETMGVGGWGNAILYTLHIFLFKHDPFCSSFDAIAFTDVKMYLLLTSGLMCRSWLLLSWVSWKKQWKQWRMGWGILLPRLLVPAQFTPTQWVQGTVSYPAGSLFSWTYSREVNCVYRLGSPTYIAWGNIAFYSVGLFVVVWVRLICFL